MTRLLPFRSVSEGAIPAQSSYFSSSVLPDVSVRVAFITVQELKPCFFVFETSSLTFLTNSPDVLLISSLPLLIVSTPALSLRIAAPSPV